VIIRWFRKPPPEWRWPGDLGRYASYSGRLAVLFRLLHNTGYANWEVVIPEWLFMAQDDLPPQARYISTEHADAGLPNFYLKGRVILLDQPR
jgi:hypothetical protein